MWEAKGPGLCAVCTSGQRLVDDTDSVGEEGGGKLSSSSTATPTLLRLVNMQDAATHLLVLGLYFSMELRLELPSLPPTAYSQPSMATRSWVLLGAGQAGFSLWGGAAGTLRGAPGKLLGVEPRGHGRSVWGRGHEAMGGASRGGAPRRREEPQVWGCLEPLGRSTGRGRVHGRGHTLQG